MPNVEASCMPKLIALALVTLFSVLLAFFASDSMLFSSFAPTSRRW